MNRHDFPDAGSLLEWLDFSIQNDTLIDTKSGRDTLKSIRHALTQHADLVKRNERLVETLRLLVSFYSEYNDDPVFQARKVLAEHDARTKERM